MGELIIDPVESLLIDIVSTKPLSGESFAFCTRIIRALSDASLILP